VPRTTTQKAQTKDYEFTGGIDSNSSNDDVSPNRLRYITDAREIQVGKWETRRGNSLLTEVVGAVATNFATYGVVTGASSANFNTTTRVAEKIVSGATGRTWGFDISLRKVAGATGTVVVAFHADNGGVPGAELFRTTIAASRFTTSYQNLRCTSITCPDIVITTTYWVVLSVQDGGTGDYQVATTTVSTVAKTSTDSGLTWTVQTYSMNYRMLVTQATTGVKGSIRVKRPNGTSYLFMAHGINVYSVNLTTGVLTSVDATLDTNSTAVRFDYVGDTLRFVQYGVAAKPKKYDFTTAFTVTTAPENANAVINHAGLEFFASADDPSKVFFTNFGLYDTFTSTDFLYIPAPQTGDAVVGFSKLTGALYIHTRNNKYILSGKENATFQLDNAIGQKGTFSQESVASDEDYIYLASDDGIYRFNGAEERNICVSEDGSGVLDWWNELLNKTNTVLELFNNRLYVFYTPNGQSGNTRCMVYNLLYNIWESDDTKTYVGSTYSGADSTNYFYQGSNRVGMLMLGEWSVNENNMLGEPLSFELRTAYNHYDSPAQYKRAALYRPHFDSVSGDYAVTIGYATDYSDAPTTSDLNLAGDGPRFDAGYTFDSGVTFGSTAQINPMSAAPIIPGEWRRLQLRYSHEAAREPVSFDGHVLSLETQRIQ
jgi:hypothetical protein